MNKPYVKQFNENGEIANPINGAYLHSFKNREKRREPLQKNPFMGNSKGWKITVTVNSKYYRYVQTVFEKYTGKVLKRINHYVLAK